MPHWSNKPIASMPQCAAIGSVVALLRIAERYTAQTSLALGLENFIGGVGVGGGGGGRSSGPPNFQSIHLGLGLSIRVRVRVSLGLVYG